MSDLKELRSEPEPFRTRPDEPDPIRAFTGFRNGNRELRLYRAHLIRYRWQATWGGSGDGYWVFPNLSWSASLCDRDAYPRRWHGGADLIPGQTSESFVPEVADMKLCSTCRQVARIHGLLPEGEGT